MRIAVTGSSGLIGSALCASLESDGHDVRRVVRAASAAGDIRWDPARGELDAADLEGLDGVVHLAGEPIGPRRWNAERKARILESRAKGTTLLAEALASCSQKPSALVSASGADFYGHDRGDEQLTEASGRGHGFMADVVHAWEGGTAAAQAAGIRTAWLRSTMVLARHGGALAQMLVPFKLGLGGRFGSGRQWMSWISLDDEVRAIRFLLDNDIAGPVNAAAPHPVTNAVFTKALGRAVHRPTLVPTPVFAVKLVFGGEMVDALLLGSKRVLPDVLLDAGFEFHHDDIDAALRAALEKEDHHG